MTARKFGELVAAARKKRGMSQGDLCEKLAAVGFRVDVSGISRIENGARSIRLTDALLIASVLDVSVDELIPASDASEATFTPTTADVRIAYVTHAKPVFQDKFGAEFDRWLAAHDAQVLAEYLRSLSAKCGGFAAQADCDDMPTTRGVFRTIATLLAEEALHQAPEADRIAGDPDA